MFERNLERCLVWWKCAICLVTAQIGGLVIPGRASVQWLLRVILNALLYGLFQQFSFSKITDDIQVLPDSCLAFVVQTGLVKFSSNKTEKDTVLQEIGRAHV